MNTIFAADLFCGAGGTSTGLLAACEDIGLPIKLFALNHWQVAITTHELNHPGVNHHWADIETMDPRRIVPGGHLRLLVASPECTHHSRARGGKPMSDQSRSSAGMILDWARALTIDDIIIENVQEFEDWGPLYADNYHDVKLQNRPIPECKGEDFRWFVSELEGMGYRVEWRVLRAADYGDPTTRERLFVRARRNGGAIIWPEASHTRDQWHTAREIIDWSAKGTSIYGRRKPLVPATMKRILAGLRKFSGLAPYLVEYHGSHAGTNSGEGRTRGLDEPLPTQDTSNRFGLAKPYLINIAHSSITDLRAYSLDEPLRTINGKGEFGFVEPCLIVLRNNCDALPIDGPVPTICAGGTGRLSNYKRSSYGLD